MNLLSIPGPHSLRLPRYQLTGAILVAGVLPYAIRLALFGYSSATAFDAQTLALVVVSTTIGYWLNRNFVTYPGVEKSSNIFPSLSMAYGVVLAVVIFWRIDYSRVMLLCGYALSLAWFYWVTITSARRMRFRVGLVPLGDVGDIEAITLVTWVPLPAPDIVAERIDAVAIDLRADIPDAWERALADFALAGTPVYHIKHLRESLTGQVDLEHISENTFGSLSPVTAYMTLKHGIDWVAAALALVVAVPLMALCAVAIRLDSAGPVLFRQIRIGYGGRPFTVYKLRTMTAASRDGVAERRAAMTQSNDMRVTKVGRLLRKTRLDELPQLLNVIRGEMSWIGPRPEAEILGKWYEDEIAFYRYRHIVRPGITGWAQVNQGHVAEIEDVRKKLKFDFYYIKNFSPWLDMLIVARTVRTMLTGYGAL